MTDIVHVAVGVIRRDKQILIAKRPEHVHQGGYWEFPGGKVEPHETVEEALVRELKEELNIDCREFSPLIQIPYRYPQKQVLLDVYWVNHFNGQPHGLEGQPIQWVELDDLVKYDFPPANRPILKAISLPPTYMITPTTINEDFLLKLEESFRCGVKIFQLRNREMIADETLEAILLLIKQYRVAMQINSNSWVNYFSPQQQALIDDKQENGYPIGVHLTANSLHSDSFSQSPGPKSASCHTLDDIGKANQRELDFIVLSPVSATSSHPLQTPMGWNEFSKLCQTAQLPVYALGGMTKNDLDSAIHFGAQGIAAIRALWGCTSDA